MSAPTKCFDFQSGFNHLDAFYRIYDWWLVILRTRFPLCTILSHGTKSAQLGRKLHSGTSNLKRETRTSPARISIVLKVPRLIFRRPSMTDFVPCDCVIQRVYLTISPRVHNVFSTYPTGLALDKSQETIWSLDKLLCSSVVNQNRKELNVQKRPVKLCTPADLLYFW